MKKIALLFVIGLASCVTSQKTALITKGVPDLSKENVQGVLWQQNAGEYRALCYQAYNVARLRLEQILQSRPAGAKPLAIVSDVDETLVDNSAYAVHLIRNQLENTAENWMKWTEKRKATALPGALEFLNWVNSKGIKIFYITNRHSKEKDATMDNLRNLGFPQVTDNQVLVMTNSSSKETRRQSVVDQGYEIALLMGDNLGDLYESAAADIPSRNTKVDAQKNSFGDRFIVFPNPVYGAWQVENFHQGPKLSPMGVDSLRMNFLRGY